ncbi:MAG TPA: hypothetical protein VGI33_02550 [Paenibacillus sp.]
MSTIQVIEGWEREEESKPCLNLASFSNITTNLIFYIMKLLFV